MRFGQKMWRSAGTVTPFDTGYYTTGYYYMHYGYMQLVSTSGTGGKATITCHGE